MLCRGLKIVSSTCRIIVGIDRINAKIRDSSSDESRIFNADFTVYVRLDVNGVVNATSEVLSGELKTELDFSFANENLNRIVPVAADDLTGVLVNLALDVSVGVGELDGLSAAVKLSAE